MTSNRLKIPHFGDSSRDFQFWSILVDLTDFGHFWPFWPFLAILEVFGLTIKVFGLTTQSLWFKNFWPIIRAKWGHFGDFRAFETAAFFRKNERELHPKKYTSHKSYKPHLIRPHFRQFLCFLIFLRFLIFRLDFVIFDDF